METEPHTAGFWIVAIAVYFLPAAVAEIRRHHNRTAIGLLNLLLGWTGFGWLVALIWSATAVRKPPTA